MKKDIKIPTFKFKKGASVDIGHISGLYYLYLFMLSYLILIFSWEIYSFDFCYSESKMVNWGQNFVKAMTNIRDGAVVPYVGLLWFLKH